MPIQKTTEDVFLLRTSTTGEAVAIENWKHDLDESLEQLQPTHRDSRSLALTFSIGKLTRAQRVAAPTNNDNRRAFKPSPR